MEHIFVPAWFVVRIHVRTEELQFYGGGGQFYPMKHARTSMRLYENESTAKLVVTHHAPENRDWAYHWRPIYVVI